MNNLETHTCECGHAWENGNDGNHSCASNYKKRITALEKKNKIGEWKEINLEKRRTIYFKGRPDPLTLSNVTHFKKRGHGYMLKCKQGIVYCETDDISCIVSECDDWVI